MEQFSIHFNIQTLSTSEKPYKKSVIPFMTRKNYLRTNFNYINVNKYCSETFVCVCSEEVVLKEEEKDIRKASELTFRQ